MKGANYKYGGITGETGICCNLFFICRVNGFRYDEQFGVEHSTGGIQRGSSVGLNWP